MDEVKTLKPEDAYSKWQYHIAGWIYSEFREKYIWASIISRHPRSLYTRCQRSVLAIGLVMTAMGFSMLFFKFDSGPADYTSFNFTLEDWWNGIKCILIAKLIFVVGFCFRMSKKTKSDELKKREKQRLEKLEKAEIKRKPKSRGVYVKHRMMMIMPAPNPKEPVAWKHRPPKKKKDKTSDKSAEEKVVAGQVRHLEKTDLAKKFWYLAWILSIIIISVSSIVIILLGIRFGKKKSLVWIATFVSGIVTDSLFFQPVKCIVFAILFSLILKRSNTDLTVMEIRYDDVAKEKSSNFDWNHCLKKMWHTRMTKPYHPALTSRILKVRALYGSRRAWYIVYYVVTLLLLLLLVILLIQALGINTSHQGLRQINSYFKEESDQVKSKAGMYKLFHYNVIPALNRVYWYNKKTPLPLEVSERKAVPDNPRFTSNVKGFTQDYTNKLVGVPRLRLLRLQKHKIKIAQTFQLIKREAYGHYFQYREDKASYLPEWTKPEEWYGDISQLWNYTSMKYTKTGYNYGKTGWVYSGAGYVVPLSWNLGHSWRTITRLELEKWTDNATRAVFFEANLYNNDIKLYTELRFIIEVLANGVYTSRLMSRATSLFFATNADAQEIIILSLIMAIVLLVYALFVTSQISKESCQHYFSDLRGYFDVFILFLGFMVILHFFLRALTFSLFLDTLETAPHDTYTSLFTPFKIDEETHVLFGLFALITAMALALLTYQALWPKNFYFVFSAIYGLLLVIIAVNVTMSYLIHYTSYSVDREPLQIFFLQTVLRDQIYTVRGDEANTRLFYVFIFPLIVVLTKFNAACVIFLHLWYSEQTYERATRNRKKHSEREKSKKRGAVRLKGSSSARAKLSEDIIILRIEKLRVSFVTVLL
ncbi:hypothetical protein GE061_014124 [Apolygus lucorum]|uniref:Polycystin domain-containing protein n=1 Tax=Apolygus lucorum TaxID=248454 RepID=A0A8S9XRU2_APOLU|nr:hypothetical protein GE061_014124 [Apolygus lucorum]